MIKASEPVVSTALNFAINKVVPKPLTALSLLPITYGVAYASTLGNLNPAAMTKEFTTKAAKMAMCSNVGFALRSILRKNLPSDFKSRTGLDPANEHAVTTALSAALMIPFVLMTESIPDMLDTFSAMGDNKGAFLTNLFLCGMSFYMYNEMQNKVLEPLDPSPPLSATPSSEWLSSWPSTSSPAVSPSLPLRCWAAPLPSLAAFPTLSATVRRFKL